MNHIIFGSSGFIAYHLREYIQHSDTTSSIVTIDIQSKVSDGFANVDVRESIALNEVADSIIYNLAAIHVTPSSPDEDYFNTNILGAKNVCDFARKNSINTIVFTSSISPYGASEIIKTEDSVPMPSTPYGISKLTAEYIHKVWQAEDRQNRRLFIVRPGVVFGLHEGGNFTRLYNSLKKGYFFYPGRKDTIKAAVYVKDVARILYEGGAKQKSEVEIYNLTLSPAPNIEVICEVMSKHTNVKPPKLLIPGWLLKTVAGGAYWTARIFGLKINGIHPDRVKKLMVSTNISGEKLAESPYKLQYSLDDAIIDWFKDCNSSGLY